MIYLIVGFSSLFILDIYFKLNMRNIGLGGNGLEYLFLFILISFFILIRNIIKYQKLLILRSTIYLFLFLFYLIIRLILDFSSLEILQAYTIGTSGGVIIFYLIGALVSVIINQIKNNYLEKKEYYRKYTQIFIIYLILTSTSLISIFMDLFLNLRDDIFLIKDLRGAYQRPAAFLTISYLIIATIYIKHISISQSGNNIFIFILFLLYSIFSIIIAQMIGSNNATFLISLIFLIIIMILAMCLSKVFKNYLSLKTLSIRRISAGKFFWIFIPSFISITLFLIGLLLTWINYYFIDLTTTRFGGFGTGEEQSLAPRLELIRDYFIIHFEFAPFFGNMNVDCLTTGCGTYVHSVLLKTLTHTGLLGFVLLLLYFQCAIKELFKSSRSINQHSLFEFNIVILGSFFIFLAVFLIGNIGTSFVWPVLWFSMGLYFSCIKLK